MSLFDAAVEDDFECMLLLFFLIDFCCCQYNLCRGSRDIRCSKGCNHHHHEQH